MPSSASSKQSLFGKTLARIRREAGFPSAWRFYHANGGRRSFHFTFSQYIRWERRGGLPSPKLLGQLLQSLRIETGQPTARELCAAYLRDLLAGDEGYELLVGTILRSASGNSPLASAAAVAGSGVAPSANELALRWLRTHHSVHVTLEDFRALTADASVYWCAALLGNDSSSWTAAQAAEVLGLPPSKTASAFAILKVNGFARETSPGRFKARLSGKVYIWPGRPQGAGPEMDAARGFWKAMCEARGQHVAERVELVRAEAEDVQAHLPGLLMSVEEAVGLSRHDKGKDTALYAFETRVRRLFPL